MCYFLVTTSLKSFPTIAHGSLSNIFDGNPEARGSYLETFQARIPAIVSYDVHRRRPAPDESFNFAICHRSSALSSQTGESVLDCDEEGTAKFSYREVT